MDLSCISASRPVMAFYQIAKFNRKVFLICQIWLVKSDISKKKIFLNETCSFLYQTWWFDRMPLHCQIKKSASTDAGQVHSKTKFAISWVPSFIQWSSKMHFFLQVNLATFQRGLCSENHKLITDQKKTKNWPKNSYLFLFLLCSPLQKGAKFTCKKKLRILRGPKELQFSSCYGLDVHQCSQPF